MYMSLVYIFLAENFLKKRSLNKLKDIENAELSTRINS